MKTYKQLTDEQKDRAEQTALEDLLGAVVEGALRFNDAANEDDLQARIDRAVEDMEHMRTPWFLGERIMEDETLADALRGMACMDAEDALYAEAHEHVLREPKA